MEWEGGRGAFPYPFGYQGGLNRQPASPKIGGSVMEITGLNRKPAERKQKRTKED